MNFIHLRNANDGRIFRCILFLTGLFFFLQTAAAQPPSAFTYPSPVAYIANVSNVFMSPTVSGTVESYAMPDAPALPAGLAFNPNTGVISGVPTEALPATVFTVIASNASGSVSTTFTMTVTNNYLNNNNSQVHFGGPGVTISHPNGTITGRVAGDITLYQNVTNINGQVIDCFITTKAVSNVSSWTAYDQPELSGDAFNSNLPEYFSPQVNFGSNGGFISYEFQFIFGGTYNSATRSGQNVVLQNVKLNTYDIDGNGNAGAFQYNEFGGFSSSELGKSPTVQAQFNSTTGLTRFVSTIASNSVNVTAAATRVRVSYENMSNFAIVVGSTGVGAALYFLDFSVGSTFLSNATSSPSVDLNTATVGVGNEGAGCAGSLGFTRPGQANIVAPGTLTGLEIAYLASDVRDGAAESLTVAGASGANILPLSFTSGSSGTVTLGDVTYNWAKSVSTVQGIATNKIAFTRTTDGTTFTPAQAEALLDALQYSNGAVQPTVGDRRLSVIVYNSVFKSPSAVFAATVNCVTLSGHIYKDQNGLFGTTDFNTISANATTGQFAQGAAYAVLTDPVNNLVTSVQPVAAGGAFSFGTITPGSYFLYVAAAAPALGTPFLTATFPENFISVGENLSALPGSDLLNDGKLIVTVGTTPVTNANFGLNAPPVANPLNANAIRNPGGNQQVALPGLTGTDPEQGVLSGGAGNGIRIETFPANARLYYGSEALTPEQPAVASYIPALLKIDPDHGALTATFTYRQVDAAGLTSEPAAVTVPFTEYAVSGTLFHDVTGLENGTIDGEPISSAGQTPLFANLVFRSGRLVAGSAPVENGTFTFDTRNGLQANTRFEIVISTVEGVAGTSTGATSLLPAGWASTSEGSGGGDGLPDGIFDLDLTSGTVPVIAFGIQMPPVAFPVTAAAQVNPGANKRLPVPELHGDDPEDGVLNGSTQPGTPATRVQISSFPDNAVLYYGNMVLDSAHAVIDAYDASQLFVDPADGALTVTFTYQLTDRGGLASNDALVTLPVTDLLVRGSVFHDINGDTDGQVNGTRISNATTLFVNLINTGGQVLGSVPLAGGDFEMGTAQGLVSQTAFSLVLSSVEGIAGTATGTRSVLPEGWVSTGEGAGAGDGLPDGLQVFTMGDVSENDFNFGMEQLPVAGAGRLAARNELGNVMIRIPATAFNSFTASSDPDGVVNALRMPAFPSGAVAVSVDGTIYHNDVPEEVAGLTALILPANSMGNPSAAIAIDPELNSETQVDIPFVVYDNAGKQSANTGHAIISLDVPLPVKLVNFDAKTEGSTTLLTWTTSEEAGSQSFLIQHSMDAVNWREIGKVAAAGNSNQLTQYELVHAAPGEGNNYYRLKMMDQDASFAFSQIRNVFFDQIAEISMYPNPARQFARIQMHDWQQVREVSVLDIRAVEVARFVNPETNLIDVSKYNPGVYLVCITLKNGTAYFRKLIVSN